jgi:DNA-directed RNA polymerase subunit F
MSNLEVVEQMALTMVDVHEELIKIEKRTKELAPRAEKTKEYLNKFVNMKKKESDELRKKLEDLNIPRLKDKHIAKIIDIQPKDMDSLKSLFSGETISFKQEELQKVLECIK